MTKFVVIFGFCVSFVAGLMVGMARLRPAPGAAPTTRPGRNPTSWLVTELNLTSEQQKALNKIWSSTAHDAWREQEDRRRQLHRDREEAIAALVHPEDMGKYDKIIQTYNDQMADIDNEMRASFEDSVNRTKELLTPGQRIKYEELLKRHQFHPPGAPTSHDSDRRHETGGTTRPSSVQ